MEVRAPSSGHQEPPCVLAHTWFYALLEATQAGPWHRIGLAESGRVHGDRLLSSRRAGTFGKRPLVSKRDIPNSPAAPNPQRTSQTQMT